MSESRSPVSVLVVAGLSSFAIALVHLVIMAMGAEGYRFFGAPGLALAVERGSWVPALLCVIVAGLLAVWGLYAFSGAGTIRPLPLLRTGIFVIGFIYFLRGLLGIPHLVMELTGHHVAPLRYLAFSLVSGITGVLYLAGLALLRRRERLVT